MNQIFVTAAAGRRDDYQIPIALAEASLLAFHVTDHYLPDGLIPLLQRLGGFGQKLGRRHSSMLPSRLVHCSRRWTARKALAASLPFLRQVLDGDQDSISGSSLRLAQQHQAGLLLYAGYGYRAFNAEPRSVRPRGLIQYHPHIRDSAAILRADAERHRFICTALEQLSRDEQDRTNQPELEIADLVVCNSSFTAATCSNLGIDASKLVVIPYGIDPLPMPERQAGFSGHCRFLFVGTGIQRKGLHHLLLAWKQAGLTHSSLTIVSRWVDPDIRTAIDPGEGVAWLEAVNHQELNELYHQSDVFVLPSLIEGFGYVYLEAMARGCFCIGTPNTGLPDIADEHARCLVPAGELEVLVSALRGAEDAWASHGFDRKQIASRATLRNWAHYRQDVVHAVQLLHR